MDQQKLSLERTFCPDCGSVVVAEDMHSIMDFLQDGSVRTMCRVVDEYRTLTFCCVVPPTPPTRVYFTPFPTKES